VGSSAIICEYIVTMYDIRYGLVLVLSCCFLCHCALCVVRCGTAVGCGDRCEHQCDLSCKALNL